MDEGGRNLESCDPQVDTFDQIGQEDQCRDQSRGLLQNCALLNSHSLTDFYVKWSELCLSVSFISYFSHLRASTKCAGLQPSRVEIRIANITGSWWCDVTFRETLHTFHAFYTQLPLKLRRCPITHKYVKCTLKFLIVQQHVIQTHHSQKYLLQWFQCMWWQKSHI